MPPRHLLLACGLASLLASPVASQTVWNVQLGDFVQGAIDQASPGDVLVFEEGIHARFTLDKPLTIVGPATFGFQPVVQDVVIDLPPGETARFVDVTFFPDIAFPGFSALGNVRVIGGTAVFENCDITGVSGSEGGLHVQQANATIHNTIVSGSTSNPSITAFDANIVITNSEILGNNAFLWGESSVAIDAAGNGSLHIGSSMVTGGNDADPTILGNVLASTAIVTTVDTWITDSTITGGSSTDEDGAPAIQATNAFVARSTILGGSGVNPVAPTIGNVQNAPGLLGASFDPVAPTPGSAATMTWTTAGAGSFVGAFVSTSAPTAPATLTPLVLQPLWATALDAVGAIAADANGDAVLSFGIPNDSSLVYQGFGLVGLSLDGSVVQVAPVIGVVVRPAG